MTVVNVFMFISQISWVIIDRSHSLRGNRASVELSHPDSSSTAEEEDSLWIPSRPDRRLDLLVNFLNMLLIVLKFLYYN